MTTQNRDRDIDPRAEDSYWQTQFDKEGYYESGRKYEDYSAAYKTGYEGFGKYGSRGYDASENELKADWERAKGNTELAWDKAKNAVKAAWHRVERAMPGDADRDGR